MNSNKVLNITPEKKLEEWRNIIRNTLLSGSNIIWVGDTETTGTEPRGDKNNKDYRCRMLELALLAFKANGTTITEPLVDNNGEQIFFHEYINPFAEDYRIKERYNSIPYIPNNVLHVHGITQTFLSGKTGLLNSNLHETDYKLAKPAPTFSDIKPYFERLCCLDLATELSGRHYFLAHNATFDLEFLDLEWSKVEFLHDGNAAPSSFESYFRPIDTLKIIKEMYIKRDYIKSATPHEVIEKIDKLNAEGADIRIGYGLEFLRFFYEVDEIERDVHGAMIDSIILAEVYKKMLNDEQYKKLSGVKNINKMPLEKKELNSSQLRGL